MLSIVWFHDDRDHPKGIDGLRFEDMDRLKARLPQGMQLLSWRSTSKGDGVGAVLVRFSTTLGFDLFITELRYLDCENSFQTEFWIREWNPRHWFIYARRQMGLAKVVRRFLETIHLELA